MENNQKSDQQQPLESTYISPGADLLDHSDEKIIDLTDVVTKPELEALRTSTPSPPLTDNEDDIIELTDMVAPQSAMADAISPAPDPSIDDEDGIIELTDIVQPQTATAQDMTPAPGPAVDDENDMIELTDIVQPDTTDEDGLLPTEIAISDEQNLLELVDQYNQEITGQLPDSQEHFEKQSQSLEDTLSEIESMMEDTFSGEEGIIQLDDVLNNQNESDLISDTSDELSLADSNRDDFGEFPIGIAIEETPGYETPDQQPLALTNDQIDAAVERLIQKKYGQTIEELIADCVEKIVTKQIESLRQSLLEDDDPME